MKQNHIEIKSFPFQGGVSEHHVMVHVQDRASTYSEQLKQVFGDFTRVCREELAEAQPVFVRVFLSDSANQSEELAGYLQDATYAVSVIEQPPLDGSKIALWAYLQTDMQPFACPGELHAFRHNSYTHWWGGDMTASGADSEVQTYDLLNRYATLLEERGMNLLESCVRTWFFVQNVDVNYAGVVTGRNRLFWEKGLTTATHFISSTGICGRKPDAKALATMDTYAVEGLKYGQMQFLYASDHLNPTAEYGVSFERGTYIDYGDRRHLFISGTASINNRGQVVHPGDIRKQVERMWENVEALLSEGKAGFDDVAHMLVYLRDVADYELVNRMFEERFPNVPRVILWAPVCRPGWLVEMECMALIPEGNPEYEPF